MEGSAPATSSTTGRFPLAQRIRAEGAALGEVFSFLSGLYFRGKLAYSQRFAVPSGDPGRTLVITSGRGLLPATTMVGLGDLREFGTVDIHEGDPRYREPMRRDLALVDGQAVLLGSIATRKYVDVLVEALGARLLFPIAFVGRGDMSRGSILLRAVREDRELAYAPVATTLRSLARAHTKAAQ